MSLPSAFSLAGRRALVTGSSRGIGAAIAVGLVEAGADVMVHGADDLSAARDVAARIGAGSSLSAACRKRSRIQR